MSVNNMSEVELFALIRTLELQWAEYRKDRKRGMPDMILLTKARVKYREIKRE